MPPYSWSREGQILLNYPMFLNDAIAATAGAITPGNAPNLSDNIVRNPSIPEPVSIAPFKSSESNTDVLNAWN